MKVFVDTWGWLTLRDKRESRHQEVSEFYQDFRQRKGRLYTSDYVLDETITFLFRRQPYSTARESLEDIEKATAQGYIHLERITAERFEKAKELRIKFHDKPRISFTDLTSMIVMTECGVTEILTEDSHFTHVGMGFKKLP